MNYGEGVVREWEHSELRQIFYDEADAIARCVLDTIANADVDASCGCDEFRKPSLLAIDDERDEGALP